MKNFTFFKLENPEECKIFEHLENFRSQTTEITSETCKKVKRKRKIAKFSACGGPNKAKEHQNIQSKFNHQKNLHSSKTNKKTLVPYDLGSGEVKRYPSQIFENPMIKKTKIGGVVTKLPKYIPLI